ncbi:DNA polymerase epsilon subunit 3 [Wallemia ichthyophaga EXF-994]|uniref:DNA polymerase epsilon subunit D n=1 Tax=Wallemia ichthyophaga (strain EXF-994 / CBS 113033) TaxID=1299270 RepID=R9AF54_WALI9|nr:DNA polymerase epsilon subunit 3 [Wallemia ichthyophaga EXF-994]EOR00823.1 DNA polymerase epsilon subunit 3 [Wallemia ichthyophaga EXF-994]
MAESADKVGQVEQVEQPSEPLQPEQAYTHTQLQQHTQQPPKPRRNLRKTKEEDSGGIDKFELPKSTVTKLAKEGVPDGAKFQKDTLLAIQKSSSVFINWLASSAQEKAHDKKNKTINAENVFAAVKEMELGGELDELLNDELAAYREIQSTGRKKDNEQEEQDVQDTNEFDPSVIEE